MKSIKKTAISLMLCTIITKLFGAFRDLTLSYAYGTSYIADCYLLATTIPVTVFAFVYDGLAASYIPSLSKINDEKEKNIFTSNLINCLFLCTIIVILLIELFPNLVLKIFASGLDSGSIKLSTYLLRLSIIGVFFTPIAYIFSYYLNFKDSFLYPVIRAIPMDIAVIITLLVSAKLNNVAVLGVGIVISLLIELLYLLPAIKKSGYKHSLVVKFNDQRLKNMLLWAMPVIISSAVADINAIIDRQFASWAEVGGIAILTYSSRTLNMIRTTFFAPIATIIFPKISKEFSNQNVKGGISIIEKAFAYVLIIGIPLTIIVCCFSNEIIQILFLRGAFTYDAVKTTSLCLVMYTIALVFNGMILISSRVFYAVNDMKTPLYISLLGLMINVIANFYFRNILGIVGLSLATSISTIFIAVVQFVVLIKKLNIDYRKHFILGSKLFISMLGMLCVFVVGRKYIVNVNQYLYMCLISMFGVFIYLMGMLLLKVEYITEIFEKLKSRLKKEIG